MFRLFFLSFSFYYSFTVPVRPRRMVRDTFAFDAVNSNTISNGELTSFRKSSASL